MAPQTEDTAPVVDSSAEEVPEKNNHEHNMEHHDNSSHNLQESPVKPTDNSNYVSNEQKLKGLDGEEAVPDQSPIEEVALTVSTVDDPSTPVYTFRMWTLGILSCAILAFLNQFFSYRSEPLGIGAVSAQIAALPLGRLMAATLPTTVYRVPFTNWKWTMNPGPFNVKEHVLITIFANSGAGGAYAIGIVTIVKAYYKKKITFFVGLLITITTQMMGYGWAGIFREYLVKPAQMWWPANLVQVSLFRTLHEKDVRLKGGLTRIQFFLIALTCSFCYYALPGYMFAILSSLSWVCWAWPRSVTAQQVGSGMKGLGVGAFALDWASVSSYLGSPLATPFFAIANIFLGFLIVMYVITPISYYTDLYHARTFPLFSSRFFRSNGQPYDINKVINSNFHLDEAAYEEYGQLHLSTFFAITYGVGFAALTSTLTHVMLFHGWEIWQRSKSSLNEKPDVHTRLMGKYKEVPQVWFLGILASMIIISIAACEVYNEQLQLRWWGVLLACALALFFTLPIGVITAITNQTPGLNIITEYLMGIISPGRPVANVCFKTYGYISMTQAVYFLSDFKLGHYMKIPPRAMFNVQILGTVIAAIMNLGTAWWLLTSIPNICEAEILPANSPWTCPSDQVFFDASVIWGLIGPKRMFGKLGNYNAVNWFFLAGAVAPVPFWILHKIFPKKKWPTYVYTPILIGATGMMPPATAVNYTSWFMVGFIFNYVVFKYRKVWWQRYNYVLSAALDAGLAFMGVLLYFVLQLEEKNMSWWGENLDNCPLATCPTHPGIVKKGCPVF
ncbi:hypothetical protein M758_1G189400 [Ceratodon purpureus]|nr:hypothetical protein M758_1G189400 [Ceratodon purpureus]